MKQPQSLPGTVLTDYIQAKASRLKIPLSGTFELSPVCNFDCRMCYVRKTRKEVEESPRRILTLDDWRRIAGEAREAGMLYLLLTGGEPLLWPDFWTLYEELIDMGFLVSINTNGSMIDEAAIERFLKKPPQRINITLYGAGAKTYEELCGVGNAFDRVDRAIRGMKEAGITVKINCSLTPRNAADLDAMIDYTEEQSLLFSAATYMFPPIRRDSKRIGTNERFTPEECARYGMHFRERTYGGERFARYVKAIVSGYREPPGLEEGCVDPVDGKIRCRAGKTSFWITWDGWMTPCGMMPEPRTDITEMTFAQAWKVTTESAGCLRLSGICDQCPNLNVCHPCAAAAYAETGRFGGVPTYMCHVTKELRRIAQEKIEIKNKNSKIFTEEVRKYEQVQAFSGDDSGSVHGDCCAAHERTR